MAKSNDYIEVEGVVTKTEKGGKFNVTVDMGNGLSQDAVCTLSGRIIQNHIRIITGDKVTVELSAYDLSKGRIIYRTK